MHAAVPWRTGHPPKGCPRHVTPHLICRAIGIIEADFNRSADTHLILPLPGYPGIDVYFKDESVHPPAA